MIGALPLTGSTVPASAPPGGQDASPRGPAREDRQPRDRFERSSADDLTAGERLLIAKLQSRDREVRAHEAAHQGASGGGAGAASFSYQTGPDGRQYAIGGEVSIDMSTVGGDPQATIAKMRQVQAAAMAPADPSAQDFAVARAAAAIASEAQLELARLTQERATDPRQALAAYARATPRADDTTAPDGR